MTPLWLLLSCALLSMSVFGRINDINRHLQSEKQNKAKERERGPFVRRPCWQMADRTWPTTHLSVVFLSKELYPSSYMSALSWQYPWVWNAVISQHIMRTVLPPLRGIMWTFSKSSCSSSEIKWICCKTAEWDSQGHKVYKPYSVLTGLFQNLVHFHCYNLSEYL